MRSTEGLVPITRAFLASYYDKYPFNPLSDDVVLLSDKIHAAATDLLNDSSPSPATLFVDGQLNAEKFDNLDQFTWTIQDIVLDYAWESSLLQEAERQPPHKIDENMWKNREQIEEILFLLDVSRWPTSLRQESVVEGVDLAAVVTSLQEKFKSTLKTLEYFQARNSEFVFNTDFRGTIIRQQRERSERNKQAEVDALVNSGGSIHDRYDLLWRQQMERRRQLAQLGSATGVYKTLVKYLVGVPQVLLDFVKQINDDQGPMEEQRQRYGPPLYNLTRMVYCIRLFLALLWGRFEATKLQKHQITILVEATDAYTSEIDRFIKFIGEVFSNSPFFITAEDAGILEARNKDDCKEISVSAGLTHEVSLTVDTVNSYIAWDFSVVQGKMNLDIGFSVECIDSSGTKTLILPYRRYESDQGNFCTCVSGNYKFIWDNSYSSFFKKVLRYKVDCIPPVVEPSISTADQ